MLNKFRIAKVGTAAVWLAMASTASAGFFSVDTRMRVGRHTSVTFINASVHDTNFGNASTALQTDNGTNDLAANIALSRLDSYNFSGGGSSDVVDNQTEYEDTRDNAANSYATIVNTLNWCGVTGSFGGCGFPLGGENGFLVTRALAVSAQAGIVYAHEFGHTMSLVHDNTGLQIMDPDVLTTTDNKCRTVDICNTYRLAFTGTCPTGTGLGSAAICSPTLGAFAPDVQPLAFNDSALAVDPPSDFSDVPIETLARNFIVDRIPHEVEIYYDQVDVEVLDTILGTPNDLAFSATILTLIGLISDGTPEDVLAIQDHLNTSGAEVSAAMMALGYIVNRTGSDIALDILLKSFEEGDAVPAALGLGLSGSAIAFDALTERAATEPDPTIIRTLQSAIQDNKLVAALGLEGYYSRPAPPSSPGRFGKGGGQAQLEE